MIESNFIPGLDLSGRLYTNFVRPILDAHFPDLPYSTALLGTGSEVLGFDTAQSMDHSWGPRLFLFLRTDSLSAYGEQITAILAMELPASIDDIPIDLAIQRADPPAAPDAPRHSIKLVTVEGFFRPLLGLVPDRALTAAEWTAVPEQVVRSLTAGRIYHDGLDQLDPIRERLRYYPHDVWLYLLACQWERIGEEEPFVGRTGQVGDELGSAIVAARLVRDLMRLAFLMEQQYAPYIKWFGSAFSRLEVSDELTPHLTGTLQAVNWQERERHLSAAYELMARAHNRLGLTEPMPEQVSPFHDRPFQIIHGDQFAAALRARITDPAVLALPPRRGGVDQYIDSTPLLSDPPLLRQVVAAET